MDRSWTLISSKWPSKKTLSEQSHSPIFGSAWIYRHVAFILAKGTSVITSGVVLWCLMETAALLVFVWIQFFKNENCHGNSCSHLLQSSGSDADICEGSYALRIMCPLQLSGFFPLTFPLKKKKRYENMFKRNFLGDWKAQGIDRQKWSLLSVAPELKSNCLLLALNTRILGRTALIF